MKAKQVPKGYWPRLFVQDGWVLAMLVWSRWLDIGHACLVKMAGYWPRLFGQDGWILATLVWSRWLGYWSRLFGQDGWVSARFFFACLWTSTPY